MKQQNKQTKAVGVTHTRPDQQDRSGGAVTWTMPAASVTRPPPPTPTPDLSYDHGMPASGPPPPQKPSSHLIEFEREEDCAPIADPVRDWDGVEEAGTERVPLSGWVARADADMDGEVVRAGESDLDGLREGEGPRHRGAVSVMSTT